MEQQKKGGFRHFFAHYGLLIFPTLWCLFMGIAFIMNMMHL